MEDWTANLPKSTSHFGLAPLNVRCEGKVSLGAIVGMGYMGRVINCKTNSQDQIDHGYEIEL